jgi:hypothetical protein
MTDAHETFVKVSKPSYQVRLEEKLCQSYGQEWTRFFFYLKEKFPRLSGDKIKESIFVGPQIRDLIKDNNFESRLNELEKKSVDLPQKCG